MAVLRKVRDLHTFGMILIVFFRIELFIQLLVIINVNLELALKGKYQEVAGL